MTKQIDILAAQYPELGALTPFTGANTTAPYLADMKQKHERKLCQSIEEAIKQCQLRDGRPYK